MLGAHSEATVRQTDCDCDCDSNSESNSHSAGDGNEAETEYEGEDEDENQDEDNGDEETNGAEQNHTQATATGQISARRRFCPISGSLARICANLYFVSLRAEANATL